MADENVNVDKFYDYGKSLIDKMKGHDVFKYTFKRSEKVKMMATKTNNKLDNDDGNC